MSELTDKLRDYAYKQGISSPDLAKKVGVGEDTARRWLNTDERHQDPSKENAKKIEDFLKSVGHGTRIDLFDKASEFAHGEGSAKEEAKTAPMIEAEVDWKKLISERYRVTARVAPTGDVSLTYLERDVIDTAEFQRLRGIKQLGTSYLVYPTAIHTRFDHSLGTLNEASEMIQHIKTNPRSEDRERDIPDKEQVLIRLGALLHDITHIPFGHIFEDEGNLLERHDKDLIRYEVLLGPGSGIYRKIVDGVGKTGYEELIKILKYAHEPSPDISGRAYMSDIIGNTICADLLDYLQRDPYFCGIEAQIGTRFMKYIFLGEKGDQRRVIVRTQKEKRGVSYHRRDVLGELIQVLRLRCELAEKVYYHHTKIAADAMLLRAFWEKIGESWQANNAPVKCPPEFLSVGDERFIELLRSTNDITKRLIDAFNSRKLHKRIWFLSRQSVLAQRRDLASVHKEFGENASNRVLWENTLSRLIGSLPGDVLIFCPSTEMQKKYAQMLITWNGSYRELKTVKEEDDIAICGSLKAIIDHHESLWGVSVLATKEIADNESKRATLKLLCDALIQPPGVDREGQLYQAVHNRVHVIASKGGRMAADVDRVAKEVLAAARSSSEHEGSMGITDEWISERLSTKH